MLSQIVFAPAGHRVRGWAGMPTAARCSADRIWLSASFLKQPIVNRETQIENSPGLFVALRREKIDPRVIATN
jgi:hypothetical protein